MEINWQDLIQEYPEKKQRLLKLENQEQVAKMKLDLKDHAGMKVLVGEVQSEIEAINTRLLSHKSLTEVERASLLSRRSAFYWLLYFFPNAELALENINRAIKRI